MPPATYRRAGGGAVLNNGPRYDVHVMNSRVNWFFEQDSPWQEAYAMLRVVLLDSGLTEVLKWGCPCYTTEGRNVVLIHGFKEYCALLFFKGALLPDPQSVLVQQTENVQAARQIRFKGARDVARLTRALRTYVQAAIAVERAGLKVPLKSASDFAIPQELAERMKAQPALKKAFEALTPGRRRGYVLHVSSAKLSKTRVARVDKSVARILAGRGLDD